MTTTIREVANRAGVSIATVSRVMNGVGKVQKETRKAVEKAARELRYVPNPLGRGLSRSKTDALGLLLPDLFGEFFSEVIRGADQTAQQHHYHLIVSSSHSNREEIEAALRLMRGRVDGVVIMSPHINVHTLGEQLPSNHPVILLNCPRDGGAFDSINIDNQDGAYRMVQHLLGHGHRRIAIITGTLENMDAGERLRGYRQAVEEAGVGLDDRYAAAGDFSEASGYDAARKLLDVIPRPTAIFASNDSMAIGALSALRDAHVSVPGEMALAGFDDIPVCPFLRPSLTSVAMGVYELGVRAVESVVQAVQEKSTHKRHQLVLPTHLAIRESCGCENIQQR